MNDYEKLLLEQNKTDNKGGKNSEEESADAQNTKLNKKELRQQAAEQRNQLKALRDKANKLEKHIQNNQNSLASLDEKLADTSLYDDSQKDKLNKLLLERAQLLSLTETLEEQWLEVSEIMESSSELE